MGFILFTIGIILFIIWAFRLEVGIAKANESLQRIEKQLANSKEKK